MKLALAQLLSYERLRERLNIPAPCPHRSPESWVLSPESKVLGPRSSVHGNGFGKAKRGNAKYTRYWGGLRSGDTIGGAFPDRFRVTGFRSQRLCARVGFGPGDCAPGGIANRQWQMANRGACDKFCPPIRGEGNEMRNVECGMRRCDPSNRFCDSGSDRKLVQLGNRSARQTGLACEMAGRPAHSRVPKEASILS
jgi:hypothetical protein